MANSNFLSVQDILDMFDVSPRTWEKWRARRLTPTGRRLPNGQLRFRRSDVEQWWDGLVAA